MKISYNWLKELIDFDQRPEDLKDMLTQLGLEVSSLEQTGGVTGNLAGLVVGEVLTAEQHPNADRLRVTRVDAGGETPLQVVCGAPNVAAGQKVAFAPVGTTLYPKTGEPFTLKPAKIRGVESQGMICAEDEIGLGESHDGIIVLSTDAPNGTPLNQVISLDTDYVLEVELTPNRVDAASHYGVARDLAAALGTQARLSQISLSPETLTAPNPISIRIEAPDRCKRYTGIYVQGVTVKESPEWVQKRLRGIGLRPINNVVDVTNIVLHELGQPLHAFDADTLAGQAIVVRTTPQPEPFVTLDGVERTLRAGEDLVICDAEKPLAIAGALGGLHSGVTEATKNILIESAYFEAWSVRRTAKSMGISTDSSFRFERGTDPHITVTAALRAAELIIQLAGGTASEVTDVKIGEFPAFPVSLSLSKLDRIAGQALPKEKVLAILTSLDMQPVAEGDLVQLQVPPFRVDVKRDVDVMEDVLRVFGYNNIHLKPQMTLQVAYRQTKDRYRLKETVSDYMASAGYQEILNNSLAPRSLASDGAVFLLNPLSEDLAAMRQSMIPGLLDTIRYNQNRQQPDLALFEWGKTYHQGTGGYYEREWLAVAVTGQRHPMHFESKGPKVSLQTLTGFAEQLGRWLGMSWTMEESEHPDFAYGISLLAGKKPMLHYGRLTDGWTERYDVRNEVFVLLLEWPALADAYFENEIRFSEIPVYPSTRRDLSLLLPEQVRFNDLRRRIRDANPGLIRQVELHDVYRGKNLPEGKKSYLVSVVMRDDRKTLSDDAVEQVTTRLTGMLEKEFGAEIRKG
jgi:phenylalanyl-tRNA synthetase beta chain